MALRVLYVDPEAPCAESVGSPWRTSSRFAAVTVKEGSCVSSGAGSRVDEGTRMLLQHAQNIWSMCVINAGHVNTSLWPVHLHFVHRLNKS